MQRFPCVVPNPATRAVMRMPFSYPCIKKHTHLLVQAFWYLWFQNGEILGYNGSNVAT